MSIRRCLGCLSRYIYLPCPAPPHEEEPEARPMIPNPSIEWKDCKAFVPPINSGYVVKVYDGDTITIASKLPYPESPLYRFAVRLNGIDTPEIKGKNEDEKKAAQDLSKFCNVFLKGGHNGNDLGRDFLFTTEGKEFSFRAKQKLKQKLKIIIIGKKLTQVKLDWERRMKK